MSLKRMPPEAPAIALFYKIHPGDSISFFSSAPREFRKA
jgi:hypothetical protein